MKKVDKSLPYSTERFLLANMATKARLQVKGLNTTRKRMGLGEEQIRLVTEFYSKDGISWQAPGHKDCVIVQQVIHGETIKKTLQSRYILMSLKEAPKLFTDEHQDPKIGISKFCELRPANIKLFDQIPHTVCVCEYHENMHLILRYYATFNFWKTRNLFESR